MRRFMTKENQSISANEHEKIIHTTREFSNGEIVAMNENPSIAQGNLNQLRDILKDKEFGAKLTADQKIRIQKKIELLEEILKPKETKQEVSKGEGCGIDNSLNQNSQSKELNQKSLKNLQEETKKTIVEELSKEAVAVDKYGNIIDSKEVISAIEKGDALPEEVIGFAGPGSEKVAEKYEKISKNLEESGLPAGFFKQPSKEDSNKENQFFGMLVPKSHMPFDLLNVKEEEAENLRDFWREEKRQILDHQKTINPNDYEVQSLVFANNPREIIDIREEMLKMFIESLIEQLGQEIYERDTPGPSCCGAYLSENQLVKGNERDGLSLLTN